MTFVNWGLAEAIEQAVVTALDRVEVDVSRGHGDTGPIGVVKYPTILVTTVAFRDSHI